MMTRKLNIVKIFIEEVSNVNIMLEKFTASTRT